MKILMMVPLWRRPQVVAAFVRNMERNMPEYAELMPLFLLSTEDPDFKALMEVTRGYRQEFVPNDMFGRKKNEGLRRVLEEEWDYYMDMGSDDLFHSLMWEVYEPYLNEGVPFFGLKNGYVYYWPDGTALFTEGYHINNKDEITARGPGRCIRRDVVQQLYPLWPEQPFGMDGYSDERIKGAGYDCDVIDTGRLPLMVSLRSNICLTPIAEFEDRSEPVDGAWVKSVFDLPDYPYPDTSTVEKFHEAVMRTSNETRTIGEAFERVNKAHEGSTGVSRYKTYVSYRNVISKKHKNETIGKQGSGKARPGRGSDVQRNTDTQGRAGYKPDWYCG